jgi:ribosomal protein L11 methylase PrmA
MKHAMVVNLCGGKLHYAPLNNPQNIIDIGTGTGIWAIDGRNLVLYTSETER